MVSGIHVTNAKSCLYLRNIWFDIRKVTIVLKIMFALFAVGLQMEKGTTKNTYFLGMNPIGHSNAKNVNFMENLCTMRYPNQLIGPLGTSR